MQALSVGESIQFGWETFKKRPWFFIGVVLAVVILSSILTSLAEENPRDLFAILVSLAVLVIHIFIEMGLVSFALKAHDGVEKATFHDLWHPHSFWKYVGVKILTGIIIVIGLILLIVPGVIAILTLLFATYLVIDRNLGPIEAMKESARMTKGHRWNLFLLILALLGINILGAIALLVGLLVSIPVSILAVAHAYRTLAGNAGVATVA